MSLENGNEINDIFLAAIDLEPEARARFLAEELGDDEDLRGEVEKMIARESSPNNAFDRLIGRKIGNYEIIKELGMGGMGAVYLGKRVDGSFYQNVAIKLVKRGMDTRFVLRRFRQERQVLAGLNHPYIGLLLDGGTTADGLPYFVMEYIEGKSIYQFSDERKLNIKDRLRLFILICEAVEYAHQNKVIHRDLKPSNILIKPEGTPKLVDFGIAKVLNSDLQPDTEIDPTLTAHRLMTPEYASPEQIKGEPVTPASDVYSLGVVLYELLTGHRPYRFKNRAAHEVARVICEEYPDKPSNEITKEDNMIPTGGGGVITLENLYSARGSRSLDELKRELGGDLERVILKALRKGVSERYQTAGELAADIENYLNGKPVSAPLIQVPSPVVARATYDADKKTDSQPKSVAILPLKFLQIFQAEDTGDQFLSIGLADALITRLSNVRQLIVRPTGSVLPYGEKQNDAFAAGKELGVDYVVDGTIRRLGNRLRTSIQLLEMKKHSIVWAQVFDEDFSDFLTLEDSISQKVAKSLLPQLTGEEEQRLRKRGTDNQQAHAAYLRGRYFANQFSEDSMLKSVEAYREAVRLDPFYALPHVGIAESYVWSAVFGAIPTRQAYPQAKAELRRALEADDSLAEALALSAFVALLYDWDWAEAERLAERAIKVNPNYYAAHDAYAHILASRGASAQAKSEIKRAEELDPLSPRAKIMTSCILYQTRDYQGATIKAEESLQMQENFAQAFMHLGSALTQQSGCAGRAAEVLAKASSILKTSALPRFMLCFALIADGRRDEAEQILQEILDLAETVYVKPYYIAMTYVALGHTDEAFKWFDRAVEDREDWMLWFGTDARLESLRNDPRYFEILKKTSNPIFERQRA